MLICRSHLVLVPTVLLAALIQACGPPPVPVKSTPQPTSSRTLPPGHPTTGAASAAMEGHSDDADHAEHAAPAQVSAEDFHFAGTLRISEELYARGDSAVFISIRDQLTNQPILSTRHTMAEFKQDGDTWVAPFKLDDSNRMMGGSARPRDVSVKVAYTPGGKLPAIGSTQPIAGSVTKMTAAKAGVEGLEIVIG